MKYILAFCLAICCQGLWAQAPVASSAAATASPKSIPADEKAVIDTEKKRFTAQIDKDLTVLDRVLANDLVYNHSSGASDTKSSFVESIRSGKTVYRAIDIEEQNARIYGNTAVINGLCLLKATSNGNEINNHLRYLSVYVKKGGQWQMVAWQSLKLAN
ncbi:nuclear transport factor 2 family protein [Spirosoma aerolatum]|uniref:nuclear transport factor 2 family protein n=1 Tax=Spirosoma aerolatum TaxID=1211326 RepID=UPI0009ABF128|nr:nuclear transport factor 2 family protein [Spirosoma aerolatum]